MTSTRPIEEVQRLYTELALHPGNNFGWETGRENARRLGYEEEWLERLPNSAWASSAAVGNPFGLGPTGRGEVVVDLGCGAGADLCIAAILVGGEGRVIGIDITPAMTKKAKDVAALTGVGNVEVHNGDISSLPIGDSSADMVISNGSINLSENKLCVFREAFRVLRPGGRIQFADMVRDPSIEVANSASGGSWADCVSGTVEPERYLEMLKRVGFVEAEMVSFTDYRTSGTTIGATFFARKPRSG